MENQENNLTERNDILSDAAPELFSDDKTINADMLKAAATEAAPEDMGGQAAQIDCDATVHFTGNSGEADPDQFDLAFADLTNRSEPDVDAILADVPEIIAAEEPVFAQEDPTIIAGEDPTIIVGAEPTILADDVPAFAADFDPTILAGAAAAEDALAAAPASDDELDLEKILAEDWSGMAEQAQQETPVVEEPAPAVEPEAPAKKIDPEPPKRNNDPYAYIRPKRRRDYAFFGIPHLFSTIVWLLLIVIVGVSLGRTLWICCAEIMAFGKEPRQVTISIDPDDTLDDIADKLVNAKLIAYPEIFKTFASKTGKADNIVPGTYTLNASLDYNAMISAMSDHDTQEIVEIMFPEGCNSAQVFQLLEENGVCTQAEMVAYLENYDPEKGELDDYWFTEDLTWGTAYCLEGYLAPDTYEFYTGDEPERILTKFLDEFDDRFTNIMKDDFEDIQYKYMEALHEEGYSSQYIEQHKLTVHDVLTLASIVEKEAGSSSECFDIASVFYNRLAIDMALGSDATVYYAYFVEYGEIFDGELTNRELNIDNDYNTRKNRGLPPGPICNPGTYALYAALDPNDTDYYYFVYDSEAKEHLFSKTEAEHEQKAKELGLL